MKRKFLSVLLALTMVFSLTAVAAQAEARPWYADAVAYCAEQHLLSDFLQDDASLQKPVTWSVLVQTLAAMTQNYSSALYASDTDPTRAPYNWARDFALAPEDMEETGAITRADAAAVFYAFLRKSSASTQPLPAASSFSDFSGIPADCQSGALFVEANSLMKGYEDGAFRGSASLSICEFAQILYNGKDLFSQLQMKKLFALPEEQIDRITVQSGTTGEESPVADPAKRQEIIQLLNSFQFSTAQAEDSDGWTYRLTIHFSSGQELSFCLSASSVTIHGHRYSSATPHFSSLL